MDLIDQSPPTRRAFSCLKIPTRPLICAILIITEQESTMATTTITIKRPNGLIETVDVSKQFAGMTPVLFETIKKATKAAGKGDCLSYEVIRTPLSDEAMAEIKAHDAKVRWYKQHGFNESDVSYGR